MVEKLTAGGLVLGSGLVIWRIKQVVAWCKTTFAKLSAEWTKLSPIIIPLVIEAENLCLAGEIKKEQRKKFVMDAIELCKKKGLIKLNFFSSAVVSMVVDKLAESIPNFDVSKELKQVIDELKGEMNGNKN